MLRCHFCNATAADVQAAIEAGWSPSYYDPQADIEVSAPFCPDCCGRLMAYDDEFGDYSLRTEGGKQLLAATPPPSP